MSWTVPADVTGAWIGDDAPTDTAKIQVWIDKAEREILFRVPDIQTRIDAQAAADPVSTALQDSAVDVAVAMVSRVFRNPKGWRQTQETTGPFSQGATFGGEQPGALFVSDDEFAKLQEARPRGAFTVDMIPTSSRFSDNYVDPDE